MHSSPETRFRSRARTTAQSRSRQFPIRRLPQNHDPHDRGKGRREHLDDPLLYRQSRRVCTRKRIKTQPGWIRPASKQNFFILYAIFPDFVPIYDIIENHLFHYLYIPHDYLNRSLELHFLDQPHRHPIPGFNACRPRNAHDGLGQTKPPPRFCHFDYLRASRLSGA